MALESVVQGQIVAYLETRHDFFFYRNNTGVAEVGNRRIRFGSKGSSDLIGVLAPSGRFVGIEVKRSSGGRRSPAQIRWAEQIQRHGGIAIFASSVDDVRRALGEPKANLPSGRTYPGATKDLDLDLLKQGSVK
jgi:hypothetical protein